MGCVLCSTVCVQQCREFLIISDDIKRLGLFRVRVRVRVRVTLGLEGGHLLRFSSKSKRSKRKPIQDDAKHHDEIQQNTMQLEGIYLFAMACYYLTRRHANSTA
eukprot:scaffold1498_cov197-Skeletonema_marinoi.AAC.2